MCTCVCMLSHFSRVQLFVTLACQGPLSMGFSRQEHQIWFPCPPPGDLPDPRIKPVSLAYPEIQENWQASSLPPVPPGKTC